MVETEELKQHIDNLVNDKYAAEKDLRKAFKLIEKLENKIKILIAENKELKQKLNNF
ncbi:hypothetical protein LT335_00668 [Spiroplasma sp. JKS002669]|uniref:hypothetical protein n=1 Tax=Spiroplasma attinicola TaxID=2904537 RepID=UPI002022BC6A|nr:MULTISPECIES: hypothetical protein [unclassified Spiroplasma]MCL6429106.1 hypothetical protein [Spiroplasma sp. JKS002669]MCL8210390.1 hypothetical protein [Spiroplasma sp. JKS002671]